MLLERWFKNGQIINTKLYRRLDNCYSKRIIKKGEVVMLENIGFGIFFIGMLIGYIVIAFISVVLIQLISYRIFNFNLYKWIIYKMTR